MAVPQSKIFLGIALSSEEFAALKKAPTPSIQQLVNGETEYLTLIMAGEKPLLGKFIEELSAIHDLILIESNLTSLIQKIFPTYNPSHNPPFLQGLLSTEYAVFPLVKEPPCPTKK